ncbi:glycosyltransferase [Candidatus Wirthbacteria bacterium CG2_30_54_11]|uniref:Glycosyltransferase n=1 Tax=Candidatus Wirthbacteria bacterium CG2_30_54_11 TaxID=1817892 RepID=A0A1J5IBH6_9BACT|nr:MAG: glycosyltransferase [Candidatus Wirthbacteria bacterium CG2_30_54_11]
MAKKLISIMTACYNEEENVEELHRQVTAVFAGLPQYDYEHLFIDNCSTDRTVEILKKIAADDKRVKIIVNARNFGHIRSPSHGLLQARGDAVISVVADLQDPPEMIVDFLKKWEEGYKIVVAVKKGSKESPLFYFVRRLYYKIIAGLSEVEQVKNFTGFGLYDKQVMDVIRDMHDPYPYFRGLIADIGFPRATVEYVQPARTRGFTKNNLYTLYDMAMLGITNHSKVPLRLATLVGFVMSLIFSLVGVAYFVYKLMFWQRFEVGLAPLVIGMFFFASVQLFFIGIIGEYIGSIYTKVQNRPLVVEKERINFETREHR